MTQTDIRSMLFQVRVWRTECKFRMRRLWYVLRFSDTELAETLSGMYAYLLGITLLSQTWLTDVHNSLVPLSQVFANTPISLSRLVGALLALAGLSQLAASARYGKVWRLWAARCAIPLWVVLAWSAVYAGSTALSIAFTLLFLINAAVVIKGPSFRFWALAG